MCSYVAPEYANTGLLNEKSDIYSFGVLLLEAVTGRDPVDYGRPANEVQNFQKLCLLFLRVSSFSSSPSLLLFPPHEAEFLLVFKALLS